MGLFGSGRTLQALSTATVRCVETYRERESRFYEDRVGIDLLPLRWRLFVRPMRFGVVRKPLLRYRERQYPGVIGNLTCRTRFIDDVLRRELRKGIDQVVILGAGFDSRAYRIPGIDSVDVFEVDHPEPQGLKQSRVRAVFDSIPAHVTFVPVDFDTQELLVSMRRSGFEEDDRTLFIWEGVTQYITEAAVDSTLRMISKVDPGSKLVFTYILRRIIEGTSRSEIDERILELARKQGNPWMFGFEPADLDAELEERGLSLLEDVGPDDYRERYLDPIDRDMALYAGEHIAVADVEGRS